MATKVIIQVRGGTVVNIGTDGVDVKFVIIDRDMTDDQLNSPIVSEPLEADYQWKPVKEMYKDEPEVYDKLTEYNW